MQKIRRSTMKHRKLLIAVVVILSVGLIGSFAVWNSDGIGTNSELSTQKYIQYYESAIAENLPVAGEEVDYATAQTLGDLYANLRSAYYQAYSENYPQDNTAENFADLVEVALGYYNKSLEAATNAAQYYQTQLDLAPETVNDYARGEIIAKRATALAFTQDNETARTLYEEAMTLAPESINVAGSYLEFIYANDGIEAARSHADAYKELVGEDSDSAASMEEIIAYYEQLEQIYAELEKAQQEAADNEEGGEEGTDEGNDNSAE